MALSCKRDYGGGKFTNNWGRSEEGCCGRKLIRSRGGRGSSSPGLSPRMRAKVAREGEFSLAGMRRLRSRMANRNGVVGSSEQREGETMLLSGDAQIQKIHFHRMQSCHQRRT